jgi:NADH-quinone oxidoreductase subunit L
MIMAIGIGAYTTGFFHLVTHAWFKACLFLASGSVIHAMHESMHRAHDHHSDAQDIRNMGGLRKTMPWTYATFLFATLAISGVPFTSGFLSKDGILAGTLAFGNLSGHWFIPFAGFGAALMTAFYMFRLTIVSFHKEPKTEIAKDTRENGFPIIMPLVVLASLSIFIFYSFNPFNSEGWFTNRAKAPKTVVPDQYQWDFLVPNKDHADLLVSNELYSAVSIHEDKEHTHEHPHKDGSTHEEEGHAVHSDTDNHAHADSHNGHHYQNKFEEEMHHAHMPAMFASLLIAGFGILLAFVMYQYGFLNPDKIANTLKPLYNLSLNKWYIDEIYDWAFVKGTLALSMSMAFFDKYVIDGIVNLTAKITDVFGWFTGLFDNKIIDGIINLTAWIIGIFGIFFKKFQTGKIQTYLVLSVIALLVMVYYLV